MAYNREVNPSQPDLGTFSKVLTADDVVVDTYTVDVPVSRDGGFLTRRNFTCRPGLLVGVGAD